MKSLTRNMRVQRKNHSLLLRPCLQRQVGQLLSARCPKQGFTKVDNMIVIHASQHHTGCNPILNFLRKRWKVWPEIWEFKERITVYYLDHAYKGKLISYCQQDALSKVSLRWTIWSSFMHHTGCNPILKCYYHENLIFSIEAILRQKQVACMRRKMLFTIFKYPFSFQRYSNF